MSLSHKNQINWENVINLRMNIIRLIGVCLILFSFHWFLIPNDFLDGGLTSIAILIKMQLDFPVSYSYLLINLPFILLSFFKIDKDLAINSLISVVLIFMGCLLFESNEFNYVLTNDKVLVSIFGGVTMGLGAGLIIKSGGGIIDGIEILSIFTTRRSIFNSREILSFINIFILLALFIHLDEKNEILYSIITFFTCSKTANYVISGFNEFIEITIISHKDAEVKDVILNRFNKAITVLKGERGYLPGLPLQKHDCEVLVVIINRLEIFHIQNAVIKIDPKAFIIIKSVKEIEGGVTRTFFL